MILMRNKKKYASVIIKYMYFLSRAMSVSGVLQQNEAGMGDCSFIGF